MPAFPAVPVEPVGKSALHPAHPLHQICPRSRDRQVKVIRHQTPRVHPPIGPPTGFRETLQKGLLRPIGPENGRAIITSVEQMVYTGGGFHPYGSGHDPASGMANRMPSTSP